MENQEKKKNGGDYVGYADAKIAEGNCGSNMNKHIRNQGESIGQGRLNIIMRKAFFLTLKEYREN